MKLTNSRLLQLGKCGLTGAGDVEEHLSLAKGAFINSQRNLLWAFLFFFKACLANVILFLLTVLGFF